jgi:hypothetical protein
LRPWTAFGFLLSLAKTIGRSNREKESATMNMQEFLEAYQAVKYEDTERDALLARLLETTDDLAALRTEAGSLLSWAIGQRLDAFAVTLIERGADLAERVKDGSLLYAAIDKAMPTVALAMLERGAKPGDDQLRLIGRLLDNNGAEKTAEWSAAQKKVMERLVRDPGPIDANAKLGTEGYERPMIAWAYNAPAAEVLLAIGANPDAVGAGGETALHHAAEKGRLAIIELLLKAGAKSDIKNADKKTPAELALKAGHVVCAARIDPSLSVKLMGEIEKKRLGKRPMPNDLRAMWADALLGRSDLLDALGELRLLAPGDEVDAESMGVPKKLQSKLCWWAQEADGAIVGFFAEKSGPLEGSVVMIDNEGQLRPYGRTVSEFVALRAAELETKLADEWFKRHGLAQPDATRLSASLPDQPVPKL